MRFLIERLRAIKKDVDQNVMDYIAEQIAQKRKENIDKKFLQASKNDAPTGVFTIQQYNEIKEIYKKISAIFQEIFKEIEAELEGNQQAVDLNQKDFLKLMVAFYCGSIETDDEKNILHVDISIKNDMDDLFVLVPESVRRTSNAAQRLQTFQSLGLDFKEENIILSADELTAINRFNAIFERRCQEEINLIQPKLQQYETELSLCNLSLTQSQETPSTELTKKLVGVRQMITALARGGETASQRVGAFQEAYRNNCLAVARNRDSSFSAILRDIGRFITALPIISSVISLFTGGKDPFRSRGAQVLEELSSCRQNNSLFKSRPASSPSSQQPPVEEKQQQKKKN